MPQRDLPPPPSKRPTAWDLLSPQDWIRAAKASHPAFKYAIVVGGLAAVVSIIFKFGPSPISLFVGVVALLLFMVLFVVFAQAARLTSADLALPAKALIWASLILFLVVPALLFSSIFFNWPLSIREYVVRRISETPPLKHRPVGGTASLHDFFLTDLRLLSSNGVAKVGPVETSEKERTGIEFRIWYDFDAKSKILGVYIPFSGRTSEVIRAVAEHHRTMLTSPVQSMTTQPEPPNGMRMRMSFKDATFSGVVFKNPVDSSTVDPFDFGFAGAMFIYHQEDLSISRVGDLDAFCRSKGLYPQFRGGDYAERRLSQMTDPEELRKQVSDVNSRTVKIGSPAP